MKLFRIAFCVARFATLGVALAQTKEGDVMVEVPFAFSVAGQRLLPDTTLLRPQGPISSGSSTGKYADSSFRRIREPEASPMAPSWFPSATETHTSFPAFGSQETRSARTCFARPPGASSRHTAAERELAVVRPAK